MSTPVVTYAGVELGGSSLFDWEFRGGTSPVERLFTVSVARANALRDRLGKPGKLVIVGPRATLTVEQVYLLEIQPGDDPNTARIRLADRRWLWPKRWVATSFNVRLTTGDKFLAGEGRIENKLIQPDIAYARYSLLDEATPWTATDALSSIFAQLATPLRFASVPAGVELQDVIVDDSGAAAVERVLSYLPGADVYIDAKGTAVVYDRFDGTERDVFDRLPPPQRDGEWVSMVDRRATRPAKVVVLFTIEAEVRHDHVETEEASAAPRVEDEPKLYQVGPVPDATLTIDGVSVARSSWAELSKIFAAWGAFGLYNTPVSFAEMRRYAFKRGWAGFELAWGNNPKMPPNAVNLARAATAVRAWRRLFQIDRFWRQRLASIRPYRVGIVNVETGAYAPATVYSDWIRRPAMHALATSNDQNTNHGWAVRGWADQLADSEPAPARVDVVDEAAGIISVTAQMDPFGQSQAMALGYPANDGALPSQKLGEANITGQEVYGRWDLVTLEADWKMSVVLTVVPGSPNDIRRFYAVEIKPTDINTDPGPCTGPTVYARVFPGVMTARFAWDDSQAEKIKAALKAVGADKAPPVETDASIDGEGFLADEEEATVTIWPSELLTNDGQVLDVALATAARIYDTLRDRPLGGGTVDMRPNLAPTGTIGAVRHTMAGGETTTSLAFPAVTQPADIWRYLNASTRKAILRVLNAGGA